MPGKGKANASLPDDTFLYFILKVRIGHLATQCSPKHATFCFIEQKVGKFMEGFVTQPIEVLILLQVHALVLGVIEGRPCATGLDLKCAEKLCVVKLVIVIGVPSIQPR